MDKQAAFENASLENNKLRKQICELNEQLKRLDKNTSKYNIETEKLKQQIYKLHEQTFNEVVFSDNIYLVDMYSTVFKEMAKTIGGMRLMKIN